MSRSSVYRQRIVFTLKNYVCKWSQPSRVTCLKIKFSDALKYYNNSVWVQRHKTGQQFYGIINLFWVGSVPWEIPDCEIQERLFNVQLSLRQAAISANFRLPMASMITQEGVTILSWSKLKV